MDTHMAKSVDNDMAAGLIIAFREITRIPK